MGSLSSPFTTQPTMFFVIFCWIVMGNWERFPQRYRKQHQKRNCNQVIQAVTFSSPSWRSLNFSKESLFHHPKKVTTWITRNMFLSEFFMFLGIARHSKIRSSGPFLHDLRCSRDRSFFVFLPFWKISKTPRTPRRQQRFNNSKKNCHVLGAVFVCEFFHVSNLLVFSATNFWNFSKNHRLDDRTCRSGRNFALRSPEELLLWQFGAW